VKGVVWYSKGFLHNASHFFNLLEYWLGAAHEGQVLNRGRALGTVDAEPDVEVNFALGSVVFLAVREECFSHYTVELLAPTGRLRYEQGGRQIEWQAVRQDESLPAYRVLQTPPESIASGMKRYQWHVTEQLARALEGREAKLCSGTEALQTLKNMQRVFKQGPP
jgi:predicted dehydrogenase